MGFFAQRREKATLARLENIESSIIDIPIKQLQMKEYAIDICAGYVARIFSQSNFVIDNPRWSYRLNVKPNANQSGAEFWREVIFQLYKEGEALVVLTDDNMLLLADGFIEREFELYQNQYTNVRVGDYIFQRTFYADDVLHFRLNNEKLDMFTASIYEDYESLISQVYLASKVSNQLRFKARYPQPNLDEKSKETVKRISEKWVEAIQNSAIVSLPVNSGLEYDEVASPDKQSLSITSLDEATWSFIDKVAVMIGIPAVLLHGEVAGVQDANKMFYQNCLEPLNQLIEDEINSKIFREAQYSDEHAVNILGANKPDVFEMAEQADKLISSGAFTRNEIRLLLGYDPATGLDEFVLTKNYESTTSTDDNLKGGEDTNEQ